MKRKSIHFQGDPFYSDEYYSDEYYPLDEILCYTGLLYYDELSKKTQDKIDKMTRKELLQRMYLIGDMKKLLDPKEQINYVNLPKNVKNSIDDNSGDPFIHRMFYHCYYNRLIPEGGFNALNLVEEKLSDYGKPRISIKIHKLNFDDTQIIEMDEINSKENKNPHSSSQIELFFKDKAMKIKGFGSMMKEKFGMKIV